MDKFLKLTLYKFGIFVIFRTLICAIVIFFIGGEGNFDKGSFQVLIAIFLLMLGYDIKVLWCNYPKHILLKKKLGPSYEDVLHQKIKELGAVELFYTNWFIEYWESHISERDSLRN